MPDPQPSGPSQDTPPAAVGGPGVEAPAAPAPGPKLVPVSYMGREVQLPEDAAQLWREREQTLSRQGQELGELRRRQAPEPPRPAQPQEPDIEQLWFERPKDAYQRIKAEVRQELQGEYQRDQAMRSFWDGFYRKHDDLREDAWVVDAMFNQHLGDLADLPVSRAQEKLGELVRSEILRLTRKTRTTTDSRPTRTMSEPATGERAPSRPAEPEDEGPASLSAAIKARQARRREAVTGARRGA